MTPKLTRWALKHIQKEEMRPFQESKAKQSAVDLLVWSRELEVIGRPDMQADKEHERTYG